MKKTFLFIPLFLVAILALNGCASVPMAPIAEDHKAKIMTPPRGKAIIYVYRSQKVGGVAKISLNLDGKYMGRTAPKTYFMWIVKPGTHEIASLAENTARLKVKVKSGRKYYVWQKMKMGMWGGRTELLLVDADEAQVALEKCKLAVAGAE